MEQPEAPPQSKPPKPPVSASNRALQPSKLPPSPIPVRPIENPAGIERVISHIAAMREAVGADH